MSNSQFNRQVLSAFCLLSISQLLYAQDTPVIVITPSAIQQPRQLANLPVTVIDSATIEASTASNLAELLRGQAGLHVSDLFSDGSQASIDLRGFGSTAGSNTLILLDGRRLNNSTDTAVPDLSIINVENIKQIEIMQGSGGVLYGQQAVGGVINIISKKITQDKTSVKLDIGNYQSAKLSASLQKVIGQTQLSVSAGNTLSDNYREHNETDKQHVSVKARHQHASFTGYVELETIDDHIQTAGALLKDELVQNRTQSLAYYAEDYFDTKTDLIRFGIDKYFDSSSWINVDFNQRVNDREFIQSFRPSPGSLSTQDRDTRNLSAKYTLQPENESSLDSLVLGMNLEQTDYELNSSIGLQTVDQSVNDLYISTEWGMGQQGQLQAGIRVSQQVADLSNTVFGVTDVIDMDETISVAGITYTWRTGDWKLYARADQNFRYPTVEESTNVSASQSFPMKPQEGVSIELGTELINAQSSFRITLYSIDLSNEIAFDASGFSNLNLDSTRRLGLILEANNEWSEKLSTTVSFTLLDVEITEGPFEGNNLPQVPEQTIRLDGIYQFNHDLLFGAEMIAVSRQVLGGDFNNQLSMMPAYQVLNAHLTYSLKGWTLSFRVNNVMDEKYSEKGSLFTEYDQITYDFIGNFEAYFPAPERNFWLSAKYIF